MRLKNIFSDFAPLWVLLVFSLSVLEALVLSVVFEAKVPDAEMASMTPAVLEVVQEPETTMHARACTADLLQQAHGEVCRKYH